MPNETTAVILWGALQEIGAALHSLFGDGPMPPWADRLSAALDEADEAVTELCEDQTDAE